MFRLVDEELVALAYEGVGTVFLSDPLLVLIEVVSDDFSHEGEEGTD